MLQSSCDNLLRLSFQTHQDFLDHAAANQEMLRQVWFWHETLGNREGALELPGVCDICKTQTAFTASARKMPVGDQFAFRVPWWVGLTCGCKLATYERAVFRALLDHASRDGIVYHVGHFSRFRRWLSEKMPNVISSQYQEGRQPGEVENGIRYEDLTQLSFPDGSFDCIICTEILEHLPDHHAGLRELARTLKPGGHALLTFPWLGGKHYDHFVRAEMMPDGSIHHLHPPEYHGDTAKTDGILCYRAFGWKILDELREAGFRRASANFVFGPLHGHMTLLQPVIVGVR